MLETDRSGIEYGEGQRYQVIQHCIDRIQAKRYLEIGCSMNDCFDQVVCDVKVGVDPERGGTLRMTSDQFFINNTEQFDVVFIDGLHEHSQVQRDFKNASECLTAGGYILFHDMLPKTRYAASWPKTKHPEEPAWNGDVWRNAFEMAADENWQFFVVQIDHGVGVACRKDNAGTIEYNGESSWEFFRDNWKRLPLISLEALSNK